MRCIVCFLQDEFQDRLRTIARLRSGRFEIALREYAKLFLAEFNALGAVGDCVGHRHQESATQEWCAALHDCLRAVESLDGWFESIRESYVRWVDGRFSSALATLRDAVQERDLLKELNGEEYSFCIRGRKSTQALSESDMYHIPFNKRFLISNQRFSITGLPLLYLGLSVPVVISELRARGVDLNEFHFSSFALRNPSSLTIADLTNRFPHLHSTFKVLHESGSPISFDDPVCGDIRGDCIREFHKLILSSCASFRILQKFEGSVFQEEYVIPQILTENLRELGFDGIAYSSSQLSRDFCYSEEDFFTNKYRENLALLTRYSDVQSHDMKLIEKFEVSRPVRYSEIPSISIDEVQSLGKEIIALHNAKGGYKTLIKLASNAGIYFRTHFEKVRVVEQDGSRVPYWDHPLGRIHVYLIYQNMLGLRNSLISSP